MRIIEPNREFWNQVFLEVCYADGRRKSLSVSKNSRVDTGAAAMVAQMFGTAAQPAAFNYVALSTSATAPAKTDTQTTWVANEITTGGLARKQATFTYSTIPASLNATALATLTTSWTATAGFTVQAIAALNAASGGTLGLESLTGATVISSTDVVNLNWALNQ